MNAEQRREAFETTFAKLSPGCDFSRYNNGLNYSNQHVEHTWEGWQAALSQPAPQGVAEVMRLAQDYADCDTSGLDNTRRALRHEKIEHAITAIVQERDALKVRIAELEGDVAFLHKRRGELVIERDALKQQVVDVGVIAMSHPAQKDAARLDWLESQINEHGAIHLHDGAYSHGHGLGLRPGSMVRTLREAIDDAKEPK